MKNLIFLLLLVFMSCSSPADDRFTYEEIDGRRHLSVTPNNLITMYKMSASDQGEVFEDLGYEYKDKAYNYMLNTGKAGADVQMISTQAVREKSFTILWVSVNENDRLVEFRKLADEPPHAYSQKQDIYLLKEGEKRYLAKIKKVALGTEVSITAFD